MECHIQTQSSDLHWCNFYSTLANLIKHKSMSEGCKASLPYNGIRHGGFRLFDVQGGCNPLCWHWGRGLWLTAQMFDVVTRAILTLNHQHIETGAEWQMLCQRHLQILDRPIFFLLHFEKNCKTFFSRVSSTISHYWFSEWLDWNQTTTQHKKTQSMYILSIHTAHED